MRTRRRWRVGRLVLALLAGMLIVLAGACSGNNSSASSPGSTGPDTTDPVAGPPGTAPSAVAEPGQVVAITPYFLRDGYVGAGQGRFVTGPDVATGALETLIEGPTDADRLSGAVTALAKTVSINSVEIADGVATVNFSRQFETANTRPQVGQVVFTLTQFPEITAVRFLIDGEPNGATGVKPIARSDLADVTPPN